MSVDSYILDGDGSGNKAHVHPFSTIHREHKGMLVLTHRFIETEPSTKFFLNETLGIAMNQDVSFGGTPEIIHNGETSTEWDAAGSASFDFASGGKIVMTSANNADNAIFSEEGATTVDWSGFTALTVEVDLTTYNELNHDILFQFDLAGVNVGDALSINTYMDTGDFAVQNIAIPKADFNFGATVVDGLTMTVVRSGGSKPTITFDDIQMRQTGTPLIFRVNLARNERFHIGELVFSYADALVSEKTGLADATETFTNQFLSYNAILGVSALTTGFVITRSKAGKTLFSATIRTLGGHISAGATIGELITDNANTFLTLRVVFPDPLILTGNPDDILTVTINDDMSGLLQFTASARGSLEV